MGRRNGLPLERNGPVVSDDDGLLAASRALSGYFLGDATMLDTLTSVSELVRTAVAGADQVGITLMVDGRPGTYVFTDPSVPEMDQAQYDTGDGPCLQAFDTGAPVLLASTVASDRHPRFCEVAVAHGILSVLSLPLATPQGVIGSMNLYATREAAYGPADLEVALGFAQQAAYLLANAQAYWDARTLAENLAEAMRSRAVIEQAKGIIMATVGCSADEAFDQLREQSQHENVKLRDIATEIVRRTQRR